MENQIPEQTKAVRSDRMLQLHEGQAQKFEESFLGKTVEILLEEIIQENGKEYFVGHTREYIKGAVECKEDRKQNDVLVCRVEGFLKPHVLRCTEL